jgi:hypothetical protein
MFGCQWQLLLKTQYGLYQLRQASRLSTPGVLGWKYSSPVPMTPYFRVEANTKHSAVMTATVMKVMFTPVCGKRLKGMEKH